MAEKSRSEKRLDDISDNIEQPHVRVLKRVLAQERGRLRRIADKRPKHIARLNSHKGVNENPHSYHPSMTCVAVNQLLVVATQLDLS